MTSEPTVSVIIPTYNRASRLRGAISSVLASDISPASYEVVVVDNNSTDETAETVAGFEAAEPDVRYVKETRLSFTVARQTGAAAARGGILAYLDDDVEVDPGWMAGVLDAFHTSERVGVVGGPILPRFEAEPPAWLVEYHPNSIWLSLFERGDELHETHSVPGPNLAVRKDVLEIVNGFPPDTIGVEAEGRPGVVEKIYVGPGDYGLCTKVLNAGYTVLYAPGALVHHVIPPIRLTKGWWHSRLSGEGCYETLTEQYERPRSRGVLLMRAGRSYGRALLSSAKSTRARLAHTGPERHEFQVSYHRARGRTELALARQPDLAEQLWNAALTGVQPDDIQHVVALLPR
jgi:glucosyl-dolichyl phosphate glucuronosyltransferase